MVCYMVCYVSLRMSVCSVHENSHAPFSESGSRPGSLFNILSLMMMAEVKNYKLGRDL